MQYLALPTTDSEDDAVVQKLAKKPEWSAAVNSWLAAYQQYRSHGGNPFQVKAEKFDPDVSAPQYALYDSRKSAGRISRLRKREGIRSCPMCGSPGTGTLDHYLPRDSYPEFSVMLANLVPTCSHCNTGGKGKVVHGKSPERFIHPYYDTWAKTPIWMVRIEHPLAAATFTPVPMATLPPKKQKIVRFHLDKVLKDQFRLSMANRWSGYPREIARRYPSRLLDDVVADIKLCLQIEYDANDFNSWTAGFFRGLLSNKKAIDYIHQKVAAVHLP